ncbi:HAMP domain-containing protein, partial [Thiolapillus sp.]|uniref:HAMP domain-containing protein n=1 Tax=Thiolapillus sp. TaxID=2017437 RepID=UPI003AF93B03
YQYQKIYNYHVPQKNIGHITPIQALKDWHKKQPELFKKKIHDLSGLDNYEKELHVHAQYLNRQLFNPLFNMNVSELNHEIKKVRVWLPVEQFLILDDQNRILTDGSVENSRYGETIPVAVQLLQQKQQILLHEDSIELNIAIHSGDDIRGYALMTLNNQVFLNSIARLTGDLEKMKSHLFHSMWTVFLAILLLTFLLGIFFSRLLSQYLSRPLSEMSVAAEQFAKGNLAYPLPEYSDDELGELARSLNTMATDLQMREGQLDALINNSTAIIYIKDIQGRFLLVNKHFQRLFHISQEEIRGKTDYDLFPAELADVFQAQACRYLVIDFGTSKSPKSTRQRDNHYCP